MATIDPSLTTKDALRSWLNEVHGPNGTASLDAKLVVDNCFTDDIELRFGNYPSVTGKETVTGFFEMQYKALDGLSHDIPEFDFVAPDKLYQPATVGWLVKGDDPNNDWIKVQAVTTFWLRQEASKLMVRKVELVLDINAVTERMKAKGLM